MTRPLTLFDRFVKVPAGILWLLVIAAVAVPVILYMTALSYAVGAAQALRPGAPARRRAARDEERAAPDAGSIRRGGAGG
ncbi:MAG TPA: hypothetical protein VFB49_06325 [Patescibacteria group bacterium]|nr:hypothetical protein [Patescibacteria group bacterium]